MANLFDKVDLTYRLENWPAHTPLSHAVICEQIAKAFGKWQAVSPFRFTRIDSGDADIMLRFGAVRTANAAAEASKAHVITFDDKRTWLNLGNENLVKNIVTGALIVVPWAVVPVRGIWEMVDQLDHNRIDLQSIAAHEIGHVLGLSDSKDPDSPMYESTDYNKMVYANGQPIPPALVAKLNEVNKSLFSRTYAARGETHWYNRGRKSFRQVEVGVDQTVWAVDHMNDLKQLWPAAQPDGNFWGTTGIGDVSQAAVLNDHFVLVIKRDGQLWRKTRAWERWDDGFKAVALGNGTAVWAVRGDGAMTRFIGDPTTGDGIWQVQVGAPQAIVSLAAGVDADGHEEIWGCGADHKIYRYRAAQAHEGWKLMPGGLRTITRGHDGTVMGTNANDTIYRLNQKSSSWEKISGQLIQAACWSRQMVWGVNRNGDVFSTIA